MASVSSTSPLHGHLPGPCWQN